MSRPPPNVEYPLMSSNPADVEQVIKGASPSDANHLSRIFSSHQPSDVRYFDCIT